VHTLQHKAKSACTLPCQITVVGLSTTWPVHTQQSMTTPTAPACHAELWAPPSVCAAQGSQCVVRSFVAGRWSASQAPSCTQAWQARELSTFTEERHFCEGCPLSHTHCCMRFPLAHPAGQVRRSSVDWALPYTGPD